VNTDEPAFHLLVDPEEAPVAASALRLLIADSHHEPDIRRLARSVLAGLPEADAPQWPASVPLSAPEMKILHSSLRLLLGDLQREQAAERRILRQMLEKLPDEHAIRAITLD
jgi:hypothetical protein